MLRAVSTIYIESQALELLSLTRRDVFKVFRTGVAAHSAAAAAQRARKLKKYRTTVLTPEQARGAGAAPLAVAPLPPPQPPPEPPQPPRRSWTIAAALALTASLGGVYYYRKLSDDSRPSPESESEGVAADAAGPPVPAQGSMFPAHVPFLIVGAGTAAFAAMRAIRSAVPGAQVLLVGEEIALPYMRPPLSKELWREPDLATRATDPDRLTFRQWNGKRRSLAYEPAAFYAPVERLAEGAPGAAVARGWRVVRLDVARHEAELAAPGHPSRTLTYDKCLIATGVRARRVSALREAAARGRSLALRDVRDAQRLAAALEEPALRTVAVLGGGFLAAELSAALADRLRGSGRRVVQVVGERAPMHAVLPHYLAEDAAQRLRDAGVHLITGAEVRESMPSGSERVLLRLAHEEEREVELEVDLVVECAGCEADAALAEASALEWHPALGGVVVNAELQARTDVYAAGDAACFYDVVLGRRRVEHHDHAVLSGRLAGENMAAIAPPKYYTHQSMFWSDLGPQLGYEAIGIIDSRLPTVGVFSADSVNDAAPAEVAAEAGEGVREEARARGEAEGARRYERGVVFYLRERRVVGVLLWNLFNRMHVARQVLAQGEFEDLFEVAKLFAPHEEE